MQAIDFANATMALGNLTLTGISGAATTFSSSALPYAIRGKAYTLGAQSGATTPTTDTGTGVAIPSLAKNYGTSFVWGVNASGTVQVIQGSVNALDVGGLFILPPTFPALPDNFCPLAYTIHKNGSTGSAWTFGTSNWNATGMTNTVVNLATMPDHPQVS